MISLCGFKTLQIGQDINKCCYKQINDKLAILSGRLYVGPTELYPTLPKKKRIFLEHRISAISTVAAGSKRSHRHRGEITICRDTGSTTFTSALDEYSRTATSGLRFWNRQRRWNRRNASAEAQAANANHPSASRRSNDNIGQVRIDIMQPPNRMLTVSVLQEKFIIRDLVSGVQRRSSWLIHSPSSCLTIATPNYVSTTQVKTL